MAMDTVKLDNKTVRMVAHRGLSGLEKENTCAAFVAACNRATYFGVETDVHRTADGQFVIFHDDNTARVGIDHMVIEETTFDTLRKLQLTDLDGRRGRIDLTIPTLMEYIEICKKYGKHCVLELKNQFKAADVYKIVSMIEQSEKLKSSAEDQASHLADKLVPYTLAGSAIAYLITRNATRALSVLMVDFFCALKLSMPLAVLSAMREASIHHATVKGGKFLEAIAKADTIVFDKTGTLTYACPVVAQVVTFGGREESEMLRLAA